MEGEGNGMIHLRVFVTCTQQGVRVETAASVDIKEAGLFIGGQLDLGAMG